MNETREMYLTVTIISQESHIIRLLRGVGGANVLATRLWVSFDDTLYRRIRRMCMEC